MKIRQRLYSNILCAYQSCSYLGYIGNIVINFFLLSWFWHKKFKLEKVLLLRVLMEYLSSQITLIPPPWKSRPNLKGGLYNFMKNCLTGKLFRGSRPEVFCNEAVLEKFTKFTGKYLHQSLLFNNLDLFNNFLITSWF